MVLHIDDIHMKMTETRFLKGLSVSYTNSIRFGAPAGVFISKKKQGAKNTYWQNSVIKRLLDNSQFSL